MLTDYRIRIQGVTPQGILSEYEDRIISTSLPAPEDIQITETSARSATLTWMEPFVSSKNSRNVKNSGSKKYDGYRVKVQRTNGTVDQLRDIGPAHHDGKVEYQLEQLEPTTQYYVYVQTYRGKNWR